MTRQNPRAAKLHARGPALFAQKAACQPPIPLPTPEGGNPDTAQKPSSAELSHKICHQPLQRKSAKKALSSNQLEYIQISQVIRMSYNATNPEVRAPAQITLCLLWSSATLWMLVVEYFA